VSAGNRLLLVLLARQRTDTNTGPAAIAIIIVTPHNDAPATGC
jgi:hypothetical protein